MANKADTPQLPTGVTKHAPPLKYPSNTSKMSPFPGDRVVVHYSVHAAGVEVENHKDFTLTMGSDLPCLSCACGHLRKAEKARFDFEANCGFGDAPSTMEVELVSCPNREDLFGDGGVTKLIVKDGDGRHPRKNDDVQIRFQTESGSEVEQPWSQVVWKVGEGQLGEVGKIVDKALLSMARNDEVELTIQAGSKYRNSEVGNKISIVLQEIFEVYDLSCGLKDGSILRKRIREGEGDKRVVDTAPVTVIIKDIRDEEGNVLLQGGERTISFVVGDGVECDALEGSVIGMKQGDEVVVRCTEAAAVAGGTPDIDVSNATPPMMVRFVLASFEVVPERWDLGSADRIERARLRKETATSLFRQGRTRLACHHYQGIADLLTKKFAFDDVDSQAALDLSKIANLNQALCMLKFGSMENARDLATLVLNEEPCNAKALFRRAKALVSLREFSDGITDLERLVDIDPACSEGTALLREARRLLARTNKKAAPTFAKMVAGLGDMPERAVPREGPIIMPDIEAEMQRISQNHGISIGTFPPGSSTAAS